MFRITFSVGKQYIERGKSVHFTGEAKPGKAFTVTICGASPVLIDIN